MRGFLGLLFISSFLSGNLFAGDGLQCHELLRRFGDGIEFPLQHRNVNLVLRGEEGDIFGGSSSGILYAPRFEVEKTEKASEPFFIKYTFEPVNSVGFMRIPRLSLFFSFDAKAPHRLHLDLNRDLGDGLADLNIFERVLKFLYQRAETKDRFQFVISEPSVVQAFNAVLSKSFKNHEAPILIREGQRLVNQSSSRPFIDSVWPSLSEDDLRDHYKSENLERILVDEAKKFPFFSAISDSGDWHLRIRLATREVMIDRGFEAPAVLSQYIVVLQPAW